MEKSKPFEHTLENMYVELENTPFENDETDAMKEIEQLTANAKAKLLSMVSKENNIEADDTIGDIEYFCKVKAYEVGFRRTMNIMLDSLYGGERDE